MDGLLEKFGNTIFVIKNDPESLTRALSGAAFISQTGLLRLGDER